MDRETEHDEQGLPYDDPPAYHVGHVTQRRRDGEMGQSASYRQYTTPSSGYVSSEHSTAASRPSRYSDPQANYIASPTDLANDMANQLRINDTPPDSTSWSTHEHSDYSSIDQSAGGSQSHQNSRIPYTPNWDPRYTGSQAPVEGYVDPRFEQASGPSAYLNLADHARSRTAQPHLAHYQVSNSHDPLLAAASSVLGGPPPSEVSTSPIYPSERFQTGFSPQGGLPPNPYPTNRSATISSNFSAIPSVASSYDPSSTNESFDRPPSPASSRPAYNRADTTFEAMPSTRKTKAIDVTNPPYTKKYVDDYRQRIKGDPDPEAHFRYAKYLIDAAKKIGANASDQKAVRKYRDSLIVESLKVIRRLATQGETYPEAQFFLANCHGTGMLGLQMDHERAYHLYLQAAKQNHASSAYRVAVCNEIGAGTRRDTDRAFAFYRKAASLGDTPAMFKLGMILLNGSLGQTRNPRESIGWLKRAAEQADQENPHALHELAVLHEMPNSQIVVHDDGYAKELYTRAANLGYTQSQFKLGQMYEFGSPICPIDPRRSIGWYTKAAEKGDPEAELALSGWYLTGSEGVLKQSDSEAYLWARRAATKGLSKAEYAVGYYAEVGIGVKQDPELAKRWYMRAAAQGNKRAMQRLTEMKREGNKKRTTARPTRQQANKDECVIS